MNRMPLENAPSRWVCNASKHHNKPEYYYDKNGHIHQIDRACTCMHCLLEEHPSYVVGPPVGTSEQWNAKVLENMGVVGIYEGRVEAPQPQNNPTLTLTEDMIDAPTSEET